ncbi:MAG: single-stranded-DNA-specific exonuclease RecJ [Flavobacteriaceae bacterium]|nr:single-stranded-DNA-specific exonuclease RecJ [Flavobacteriaceae bacterium]
MRWSFKPIPENHKIDKLAKELNIDTELATLLVQRGIETYEQAKRFFRPSLADLHNPYLMKDMDKAVARIEKALKANEKIMVYGDYDVDGTTSVALVYVYLSQFSNLVTTYIPDRYTEGYGISYQGIDFAADNDISLIIALDCGIKEAKKVAYATEKNIDFVICDHHLPGVEIPKAVAVLNPKQVDCEYPFKELCGCGVGFKLIQALAEKNHQTIHDLIPFLDLVATAIAADIVPMDGENRILAYFGLIQINQNPRPGIKALIHQLKKEITITEVVFQIAPRINAAGRIKHGNHAVELLIETNLEQALQYAEAIEKYNTERRDLDQEITKQALHQIIKNKEENDSSTVVFNENWMKGVIGIVASRLIETYYRPTIVFTKSDDFYVASARSVNGFDLYSALEQCEEFIVQFGGHKHAAGITIKAENYHLFKNKFKEVVQKTKIETSNTPTIEVDLPLDLSVVTPKFYRVLKQFAPFGPANMNPVFLSVGLRDNGYGKAVGADGAHVKLNIINGADAKTYNAIGFNLAEQFSTISNSFQAVYSLEENHWNGNSSIQLMLKDLKPE